MMLRGNRKFLMAATALVMGFLLALLDKLSADFATIASVCVGAYSLANAYTTGRGGEPTPTSGDPEDAGGSA